MPQLFRHLSALFGRRTKATLGLAVLGSVLLALLDTVAIALVLPLVDLATGQGASSDSVSRVAGLLQSNDLDYLTAVITATVVCLFVVKDLGAMWFNWWVTGFVYTERVRTSARILDHMLHAPYTELSRRSQAELMRAMDSAVMQVFNYSVSGLMYAVSSGFAVLSVLVTLLLIEPLLTLVLVAYFGTATLLFAKVARPRANEAGQVMNRSSVDGLRAAFAALGAVKELSLRGTQTVFVGRFRDAQLRGAHAGRTATFISTMPKYLLEILFILAIGLVVLLAPQQDAAGRTGEVGLVALFVTAGFRLLPSITAFMANITNTRVGADSLRQVHEEVVAARAAALSRGSRAAPHVPLTFDEGLSFRDVRFRYPGRDVDVLRGVTLSLRCGESLAIVGPSGAGKTTLIDLLLGLHVPASGSILSDGVDISGAMASWRSHVAYVPQDVYVLDASLKENVAFDEDADDIDEERVRTALEQAQLHEFLDELPDGLNTQLGERGTALSGGQRQRVGIARALYRRPRLLVLDEATSALDNETEFRFNQTVAMLHGAISVVVVAHRLSTVRQVDEILLLSDGKVRDRGSFDELTRRSPEFARMVELGSLEPR